MPFFLFPLSPFLLNESPIKSLKHTHSSFLRNHQLSNRAFLLPHIPHLTSPSLPHTAHISPSLTTTPILPPHLLSHNLTSLLRYTHNISLSTTPNTTSLPHSTSPSLPHSPHYWFIIIILDSPQFYFLLLFLFLFLFLLLTLYFSRFFSPDHALMIVFFPSSSGKRKIQLMKKRSKIFITNITVQILSLVDTR